MKTKEWFKANLKEGFPLTEEVLMELLDSYIHKSDLGHVIDGETLPVPGGDVADALKSLKDGLIERFSQIVDEAVRSVLPQYLGDYIKSEYYSEDQLQRNISIRQWVSNQLADLAKNNDVEDRFRTRTSEIYTEVDRRLDPYAKKDKVAELVDLSPYAKKNDLPTLLEVEKYALKTDLPDEAALVLKTTFTEKLAEINTSIAAKATSADVATAKQEAIDTAAQNTSNICALPSDFDSNGLFIRKTQN